MPCPFPRFCTGAAHARRKHRRSARCGQARAPARSNRRARARRARAPRTRTPQPPPAGGRSDSVGRRRPAPLAVSPPPQLSSAAARSFARRATCVSLPSVHQRRVASSRRVSSAAVCPHLEVRDPFRTFKLAWRQQKSSSSTVVNALNFPRWTGRHLPAARRALPRERGPEEPVVCPDCGQTGKYRQTGPRWS